MTIQLTDIIVFWSSFIVESKKEAVAGHSSKPWQCKDKARIAFTMSWGTVAVREKDHSKMKTVNQVFALGINHHEKQSWEGVIRSQGLASVEAALGSGLAGEFESLVSLITCNRIELYGQGCVHAALSLFESTYGSDLASSGVFVKQGRDAIEHLFRVSCGLDSQLIGEMEIAGQFRNAFKEAKQKGRLNGLMEQLGNRCVSSSKGIRSQTRLTEGTSSLSYSAVKALLAHGIKDESVLIIGAGHFARSLAKNLKSYLPDAPITICNRSLANAKTLAAQIGAEQIPLSELDDQFRSYNIVIAAVNTIGRKKYEIPPLGTKEQVIMDLCVPGFFDRGSLPNAKATFYDIEQLSKEIERSLQTRRDSIPEAVAVLEHHMREFLDWAHIYEKSACIKNWKSAVETATQSCPFFRNTSDQEKKAIVNKSTKQFVHYLKNRANHKKGDERVYKAFLQGLEQREDQLKAKQ